MKKIEAAKRNDARLYPVKLAAQPDAILTVIRNRVPLLDAAGWDVKILDSGECSVDSPYGKFTAPLHVGRLLSLLGNAKPEQRFLETAELVIYLTSTSDYRKARGIVARENRFGIIEELDGKLSGIVPIDVFESACRDALAKGMLSEKPMAGGKSERTKPSLCSYQLKVSIGIVECPIRLDHALALVKRAGGNRDVYGDKLEGAVPFYPDDASRKPKWKLAYSVADDGSVPDADVASIDHVAPRSKGGADRLVNMQLMRKSDNSRKSSAAVDQLPDPMATAEALKLLIKGVASASADKQDPIDPFLAADLTALALDEMKAAERAARRIVREYSGASAKLAKQVERVAKVRDDARQKVADIRREEQRAEKARKAEEAARKKAEAAAAAAAEKARKAEEAARRKAEAARKKAEETAREKAEKAAREKAEKAVRKKAERAAREEAEEATRRKQAEAAQPEDPGKDRVAAPDGNGDAVASSRGDEAGKAARPQRPGRRGSAEGVPSDGRRSAANRKRKTRQPAKDGIDEDTENGRRAEARAEQAKAVERARAAWSAATGEDDPRSPEAPAEGGGEQADCRPGRDARKRRARRKAQAGEGDSGKPEPSGETRQGKGPGARKENASHARGKRQPAKTGARKDRAERQD